MNAPVTILDPVVEANRALLLQRSQVGISKYGVTLASSGLSHPALMQHALEEALDLANYIQAHMLRADEDAARIASLERQIGVMGQILHNTCVAQQAAWIEWRNGEGAESAMEWIENGLTGPGLLPSDDNGNDADLVAQKWFDENCDAPLAGQKGMLLMEPPSWRGALLWTLYHHQGGSSPVGQPIRALLGMGEHDRMTPDQIEEARAFGAQRSLSLPTPAPAPSGMHPSVDALAQQHALESYWSEGEGR